MCIVLHYVVFWFICTLLETMLRFNVHARNVTLLDNKLIIIVNVVNLEGIIVWDSSVFIKFALFPSVI